MKKKPSTCAVAAGEVRHTSYGLQPIDSHIEQVLGEALRMAFQDVTNEPVPDRFVELLERLSREEKG